MSTMLVSRLNNITVLLRNFNSAVFIVVGMLCHKLTKRSLPLRQSPPPAGSSVKEKKGRGKTRISSHS